MKTASAFEHFVVAYYDMYLEAIEEKNQNNVNFCLDRFRTYELNNIAWLKNLDINSLLFFVAFNDDARLAPDIVEYACERALKEMPNLHIFSAYLANSNVMMQEEYETVFELVKMLLNKVDTDMGYSFELPYLKHIKNITKEILNESVQDLVEMNWVDEYQMAKEMCEMTELAISKSARHKAYADGWRVYVNENYDKTIG